LVSQCFKKILASPIGYFEVLWNQELVAGNSEQLLFLDLSILAPIVPGATPL
jgi:hypothetical protein